MKTFKLDLATNVPTNKEFHPSLIDVLVQIALVLSMFIGFMILGKVSLSWLILPLFLGFMMFEQNWIKMIVENGYIYRLNIWGFKSKIALCDIKKVVLYLSGGNAPMLTIYYLNTSKEKEVYRIFYMIKFRTQTIVELCNEILKINPMIKIEKNEDFVKLEQVESAQNKNTGIIEESDSI